ncbi:MAG: hypothetical protein C4333_11045 [Meiothermus sp.]
MRVIGRWGGLYLLLLTALSVLGYFNQSSNQAIARLEQTRAELEDRVLELTLRHYQSASALALREWAKNNGFVPMSLAQWAKEGQ